MGIKNLFQYIRQNHSDIIQKITFNDLRDKKLIIDFKGYLYKLYGDSSKNAYIQFGWLYVDLISINCEVSFIVDGVNNYELKKETHQKRKKSLEKSKKKLEDLSIKYKECLEEYKLIQIISEFDNKLNNNNNNDDNNENFGYVELNNYNNFNKINYETDSQKQKKEEIKNFEEIINKCKKCILEPTNIDIELILAMLKHMGAKIIYESGEGEAGASYLNRIGKFDYVISEDSDCLIWGCDKLITGISSKSNRDNKELVLYHFNTLREKSNLGYLNWIDIAILTGTDFNNSKEKKVKGYGINKSIQAIKTYKNLENFLIKKHLDIQYPALIKILPIIKNLFIKYVSSNTLEFYEEFGPDPLALQDFICSNLENCLLPDDQKSIWFNSLFSPQQLNKIFN